MNTSNYMGGRVLARGQTPSGYRLRIAESPADVRAAQTLRFLVFNLEMNEGLESSYATLRDEDPFDAICDHLLVEEESTGDVVGTYRLQTGRKAALNLGFYSAREFDLFPLEPLRPELVELGRACVHSRHRNLAVLALLWKGIAAYARDRGGRYLIGCSSLSSTDARVGASAYSHLMRRHLVEESFQIRPQAGWECPLTELAEETPKIPRLLTAYLSFGAKICGQPAIDREFRTIDFFTLLDLETLPDDTVNRFLR
jgi:putative hemolysin